MRAIVPELRYPSGRPVDRLVEDELGVNGRRGRRGCGEGCCGECEERGERQSE